MTPQPRNHIIAGHNGGKRISCKPELLPAFQRLEQAARRGNYWAALAMREIRSLTSGLDGKSNVYFRPGDKDTGSGAPRIVVFLPGLKATLVKWADGNFRIVELQVDGMYQATQREDHSRLGLYRANATSQHGNLSWRVKYEDNGCIQAENGRLVAVADGCYLDAARAAEDTIPRTIKTLGVAAANNFDNGCDLHFTPGRKRLGNYFSYNALAVDNSRASALLLAESMIQARTLTGVIWAADKGGSTVLTQAMAIVADKGFTLKGHISYLYKSRTSPGQAVRSAHRLEMTLNESFADTGMDVRGAASLLAVAGERLHNGYDRYNKTSLHQDWLSGLMKVAGAAGTVGFGATALGVPIVMVSSIAGAITAGGAIIALGKSVKEDIGHRFKR